MNPVNRQMLEALRNLTDRVEAEGSAYCAEEVEEARAAIASAGSAEQVPADEACPLKGWKLNHVQAERGSGKAEIGYLDPEGDHFSPVVTVDAGLYYQPDDALPMARAIFDAMLAASPTPPPAAEPVALQGGMSNPELALAWARKLPGVAATDRDMTAFALGVEVGMERATPCAGQAPVSASEQAAPFGYCPKCGAPGVSRERRPNGNDQCSNGHTYPSRDTLARSRA